MRLPHRPAGSRSPGRPGPFDLADYDATTTYFRTLVDVRFKLLALLKVVTGAAIAWSPRRPDDKLALAALGLIVTFALAL